MTDGPSRPLTLLVVDDHEVVRQGLSSMLDRRPGFQVVAEAGTVAASIEMAKRFHNPALADAAGARAYVDAQWNEATVKQRYDWIFQYDAATVAI